MAYCPECGAGQNPDGTMRLPNGWPLFNAPCKTCEQAMKDRAEQIGRAYRDRIEKRMLQMIFGTDQKVDIAPSETDAERIERWKQQIAKTGHPLFGESAYAKEIERRTAATGNALVAEVGTHFWVYAACSLLDAIIRHEISEAEKMRESDGKKHG